MKRKGLKYENNDLHFVGIKCEDIARKFGTPLYVMSEDIIRDRYRELKETLDEKYRKNHIEQGENYFLSCVLLESEEDFYWIYDFEKVVELKTDKGI